MIVGSDPLRALLASQRRPLAASDATRFIQQSLGEIGVDLTDAEALCASEAYADSGQPLYFAIGIGVAAGENGNASAGGVLAHNNPIAAVLGDGKGIDHLEQSGIFPALEAAAVTCGIPV